MEFLNLKTLVNSDKEGIVFIIDAARRHVYENLTVGPFPKKRHNLTRSCMQYNTSLL